MGKSVETAGYHHKLATLDMLEQSGHDERRKPETNRLIAVHSGVLAIEYWGSADPVLPKAGRRDRIWQI
jgi:hypothetical protein